MRRDKKEKANSKPRKMSLKLWWKRLEMQESKFIFILIATYKKVTFFFFNMTILYMYILCT